MMQIEWWWGVALGLGLVHTLDADHLAAVSTILADTPNRRAAARVGAFWAMGHTLAMGGLGGGIVLLGLGLSHWAHGGLDLAAGLMLLTLGLWRMARAVWPEPPKAKTEHHSRQGHRLTALLVGTMHGLAGSALVLSVVPAMVLQTPWRYSVYLLLFGLGNLMSMVAFCLAGQGMLARLRQFPRLVDVVLGVLGLGVGARYIVQALAWVS